MKKVFSLLLIFAMLSCSKNEDKLLLNDASIALNGITYQVNDQISANENCNTLFINFQASQAFPYVLDLTVSKKGDVINATVADQNVNYNSLAFNSTETFKITTFEYDSVNTSLKMNFEGTLFGSKRSASTTIKGEIKTLDIKPTVCSSVLSRFEAEVEDNTGKKERLYSNSGVGEFDSKAYRQYYYSNNGYRIVLESKTNFNSLERGEYAISSNPGSTVKVTFQKYIGRSDDQISTTYSQNEWKSFRIEGTVEISQPILINGTKGTRGKLNVTAFDENNKAIYQLRNGNFIMANINN